jgi:hypothetical protein
MTAVTQNAKFNNTLTNALEIHVADIQVSTDYTYTPANPTGKTLKVLDCYAVATGVTVKATISAGVITFDNGGSLSNANCMLMYTFV